MPESSNNSHAVQPVAEILLLRGSGGPNLAGRGLSSVTQHPSATVGQDDELLIRAVWAAFREVEQFFTCDPPRFSFDRSFFGNMVPAEILPEVCTSSPVNSPRSIPEEFWQRVRGRFTGTIDQLKTGQAVRDLLKPDLPANVKFCIVTDQELTPWPDQRYVISDDCTEETTDGAAISLAVIDPRYWRAEDSCRISTVKHRVRTVLISTIAESTGMQRCENPLCFLYKWVVTPDTLDDMVLLGSEHAGYEKLHEWGFARTTDAPEQVQQLVERPQARSLSEASL